MQRRLVLVCFGLAVLLSASVARAQAGYVLGLGLTIPVGEGVTDVSTAGVHIDAGAYWSFPMGLSAGGHLSYDLPFGKTLEGTTKKTEAQFASIAVRGMFTTGIFAKFWISLGFGLYFNKLTITNEFGQFEVESATSAGVDLGAGIGFTIFPGVTIGPGIGVVAPRLAFFQEQMLVTGFIRGTYGL